MRNDLPDIYHQRIFRQSVAIEVVEDNQACARLDNLSTCRKRIALCIKCIKRVEHIYDVEGAGEHVGPSRTPIAP